MKQSELKFSFHNPNTVEDTANYLLKLFVEVNRGKVDDAIRQAEGGQGSVRQICVRQNEKRREYWICISEHFHDAWRKSGRRDCMTSVCDWSHRKGVDT